MLEHYCGFGSGIERTPNIAEPAKSGQESKEKGDLMNNEEYWYFSGYRDAVIACIELLFGERGPVPSRKDLAKVLKTFRKSRDRKGLVRLFGNKR